MMSGTSRSRSGRDEAKTKNPIRNVLRVNRDTAPADELRGMTAAARDVFHNVVGQELSSRYKRPPIYLADDWLVRALGIFAQEGPVVDRTEDQGFSFGHDDWEPDTPRGPSPLGPTVRLFEAYSELVESLDGARLLELEEERSALEAACFGLLDGTADANRVDREACALRGLVERAAIVLLRDKALAAYISEPFLEELAHRTDALVEAARDFEASPRPRISAVGFGFGRHGGVLFQSVPELEIWAPAILIAPGTIRTWSEHAPEELGKRRPDDERWFGVGRAADDLRFALALSNVVQHELTHAMLALPNNPAMETEDLRKEQWRLYRESPELEEGLCNFLAYVCSVTSLVRSESGRKSKDLPNLSGRKYSEAYRAVWGPALWLHQRYHEETTENLIRTWERQGLRLRNLAGLFNCFATNPVNNDWRRTLAEARRGLLVTGLA